MKVEVFNRSEKSVAECDYRGAVEINIDGKEAFSFFDGEPEDANLSRDFSDVYSIPQWLKAAHTAGVNGEPFEWATIESDEV